MNSPVMITMPDVARRLHPTPQGALDRVGMSNVRLPVTIRDAGVEQRALASARVYVDLRDPLAKGIHMSRLYLLLEEHASSRVLDVAALRALLGALLGSHGELSSQASTTFDFEFERRRSSLLSGHHGWNVYPTKLQASLKDGATTVDLGVRLTYSSTCPCSAALARQLIQRAFADRFGTDRPLCFDEVSDWLGTEQGIVATPHSQRSFADVTVRLAGSVRELPIGRLIDGLEDALGTPVQTAVKREDEQEFARLNGQNLMFCEDAARRLVAWLEQDPELSDYLVRIDHHESLHAHDAQAVVVKGVPNGFRVDG